MPAKASAIVLQEHYDKLYQIADHELVERTDPLSPVGFHQVEDTYTGCLRYQYMERFKDSGVLRVFGLNFTEFLAQPREDAEEMIKIALKATPGLTAAELEKLGLGDFKR